MNLEDKVLLAQKDDFLRNNIIKDYKNYILLCTQKVTGRYITDSDDEMSVAMIAFNEAITKYDVNKGSFLNFANLMIKSRLIDFVRKEYKNKKSVPFSELSQTDKDGNVVEFDTEDTKSGNYDAKLELAILTDELKKFDISFFDLQKVTPKSKKTKLACFSIIRHIIQNSILTAEIKLNGVIPIKTILDGVNINRKVIERHRKYIITAVVILTGDYEIIAEYFKDVKEV